MREHPGKPAADVVRQGYEILKNHLKLIFLFLSLFIFAVAPLETFAKSYEVDHAATRLEFRVRHMVIAWVRGSFSEYDGSFDFDPKTGNISNVKLVMKVKSINTKHAQRDAELMLPKFFWAEKYPDIVFNQTGFRKLSGGKLEVTGDLTIKDTTRRVTLDGEYLGMLKNEDNSILVGFRAETVLKRRDFNMHWDLFTKNGALIIGDSIILELEVQGRSN